MKTIPCENCISYVICRQAILNHINWPITYLRNKCKLFDNFAKIKIDINGFKLPSSMYNIIEEYFQLNFKIKEEQHKRRYIVVEDKLKKCNQSHVKSV